MLIPLNLFNKQDPAKNLSNYIIHAFFLIPPQSYETLYSKFVSMRILDKKIYKNILSCYTIVITIIILLYQLKNSRAPLAVCLLLDTVIAQNR